MKTEIRQPEEQLECLGALAVTAEFQLCPQELECQYTCKEN